MDGILATPNKIGYSNTTLLCNVHYIAAEIGGAPEIQVGGAPSLITFLWPSLEFSLYYKFCVLQLVITERKGGILLNCSHVLLSCYKQ